ncbi:hypothetical protein FCR2A7T_24510 [Flavobacterium cauense R2A-7]|uniref:Uncharacterized protein DUF433 n=1 Tax=Flavobacterium cauense R2A-7 TaxID=1341154 RepID=V6RYC8_9FLAO|nr:DUF433 domain-containing protein [Flavobacterium cauense]ESU19037.1 hypothetical protein FCR2A7T_24510 [Flavobacterium cauense R2A-7]KGO82332.1 hypothetical protein Q762_06560 [Flavobacterium cauense R2A-7]TWI15299.1 uncharacterized protein DUF433 [Flavobacterium cauense R2A-7]
MFENKLELGNGIFTTQEIAQILRLPYHKVRTWITKYWDGDLGKHYEQNYSWSVENSKAVGFHTLIEFYVMMQFAEAGVKTKEVLKAHKELSILYNTNFPFAKKEVLENIKTDKLKVYLKMNGDTISLDGSKQLNLELISMFFHNLDFDNELLASRFWPLGKKHKIVCDPHHKFGQPVISGTNIQSEVIYKMYQSNEPVKFIAALYEISEKEVKDAILFHLNAA